MELNVGDLVDAKSADPFWAGEVSKGIIIAIDKRRSLLNYLIASSVEIFGTAKLNSSDCGIFEKDPTIVSIDNIRSYIGSSCIRSNENKIVKLTGDIYSVKKPPSKIGCKCKRCLEYYEYAEPNQKDDTLICYTCRLYGG